MKNLEFAIITEFNRIKFMNELNDEQLNLINDSYNKIWESVNKTELLKFDFNGDYIPLYKNIALYVIEILENNNLNFSDKRCYTYLVDSVYEMIKNKK